MSFSLSHVAVQRIAYSSQVCSWHLLYFVDIETLESYFDKQRRQQEKGRDMISQIQALSDSLRTNNERLTSAIQEEVQSQVKDGLTR